MTEPSFLYTKKLQNDASNPCASVVLQRAVDTNLYHSSAGGVYFQCLYKGN